jgi:hypothetical protein
MMLNDDDAADAADDVCGVTVIRQCRYAPHIRTRTKAKKEQQHMYVRSAYVHGTCGNLLRVPESGRCVPCPLDHKLGPNVRSPFQQKGSRNHSAFGRLQQCRQRLRAELLGLEARFYTMFVISADAVAVMRFSCACCEDKDPR